MVFSRTVSTTRTTVSAAWSAQSPSSAAEGVEDGSVGRVGAAMDRDSNGRGPRGSEGEGDQGPAGVRGDDLHPRVPVDGGEDVDDGRGARVGGRGRSARLPASAGSDSSRRIAAVLAVAVARRRGPWAWWRRGWSSASWGWRRPRRARRWRPGRPAARSRRRPRRARRAALSSKAALSALSASAAASPDSSSATDLAARLGSAGAVVAAGRVIGARVADLTDQEAGEEEHREHGGGNGQEGPGRPSGLQGHDDLLGATRLGHGCGDGGVAGSRPTAASPGRPRPRRRR